MHDGDLKLQEAKATQQHYSIGDFQTLRMYSGSLQPCMLTGLACVTAHRARGIACLQEPSVHQST